MNRNSSVDNSVEDEEEKDVELRRKRSRSMEKQFMEVTFQNLIEILNLDRTLIPPSKLELENMSCIRPKEDPSCVRNVVDMVLPDLYLGDENAAHNITLLERLGVTDILDVSSSSSNTGHGGHQLIGSDIGRRYHHNNQHTSSDERRRYRNRLEKLNIVYKQLNVIDYEWEDIYSKFDDVVTFIDEARQRTIDKPIILVHCQKGVSRSSTCVIAYLMIRHKMTAEQAVSHVRRQRNIRPNDGFLRQLATLNYNLLQLTN